MQRHLLAFHLKPQCLNQSIYLSIYLSNLMVFVLPRISFHRKNTIRNLSIYLFIYLSIHLSIYLSIYLSIHLFIYLSIYIYLDARFWMTLTCTNTWMCPLFFQNCGAVSPYSLPRNICLNITKSCCLFILLVYKSNFGFPFSLLCLKWYFFRQQKMQLYKLVFLQYCTYLF